MKKELKGFPKIFSFTFRNQVKKKGYKNATILVAILCLLIPALAMTATEYFGQETSAPAPEQEAAEYAEGVSPDEEEAVDMRALQNVYVVDLSQERLIQGEDFADYDYEEATGIDLSGVTFIDYGSDFERARQDGNGSADTLLLILNQQGNSYQMNVLIPENSRLHEEVAHGLETALMVYVDGVLQQLNGDSGVSEKDAAEETFASVDGVSGVLGFVLPYVNMMLLYFFVLFYGQGVSQSVIMEKTSKLMDVFLISVKPAAMILGKVIAICLAGVMQLVIWLFSLGFGFALGVWGVKTINSQTDMVLVQLFESFGNIASGMFSVGGVIVAILLILAGMLLYCAMSGMGGAIAGKPEDLSSTNITFTLVLVVSFFAVLYCGGLEGADGGAAWLDWVPFTSIMITPSRVLLGSVSVVKGLGCLAIVLVTAFLFVLMAGKMYKMMALYKGDLPNGKQMAEMLRQRNH